MKYLVGMIFGLWVLGMWWYGRGVLKGEAEGWKEKWKTALWCALFIIYVLSFFTYGKVWHYFLPWERMGMDLIGAVVTFLDFFLILLIVGMYPGGMREVGWKRGWGKGIFLGVLIHLIFIGVIGSFQFAFHKFFPQWRLNIIEVKNLFSDFRPFSVEFFFVSLMDHLFWVMYENMMLIFLLVRLERLMKRTLIPSILIAIFAACYHIDPRRSLVEVVGTGAHIWMYLLIFILWRHFAPPAVHHFLWNIM